MENLVNVKAGVTVLPAGTALSSGGVEFAADAAAEKIVLLVVATADDTVTVKAGNGVFAGTEKGYAVKTGTSLIRIELGRHLSAGKIKISGASTSKAAVLALD